MPIFPPHTLSSPSTGLGASVSPCCSNPSFPLIPTTVIHSCLDKCCGFSHCGISSYLFSPLPTQRPRTISEQQSDASPPASLPGAYAPSLPVVALLELLAKSWEVGNRDAELE